VIDPAADLAKIMADVLAVDAVYTPLGGAPAAIRVLPRGGDWRHEVGAGAAIQPGRTYTTSAAGLARPQGGDTIVVGGETFTVLGAGIGDSRGLIWTFEVALQ
jgi:hypothetical protein